MSTESMRVELLPFALPVLLLVTGKVIISADSAMIRNAPGVFAVTVQSLGRSVSHRARQQEEWGWVVDVLGRLATDQEDLQA